MILAYLLIGLLAGYLAGFLGIGGGFVVVPALTWLFLQNTDLAPFAVHMAVATSLGTMLVTSFSSILAHHRRRAIRWTLVRALAPGLVIGAVLGALLADRLDGEALVRVVGMFAILAGLQLVLGRKPTGEKELPGQPAVSLVGVMIGGISSLIGIGGGALTGIVGVNRDAFGTGMGARLIFNTDVFCFAPPDFPDDKLPSGVLHPRRIFKGVRVPVGNDLETLCNSLD